MSSVSGGGWLGTDQPAVLDALSFSKIITNESSFDLADGIWRYPSDILVSFMNERSIPDICAVVNAEWRLSSGVDGMS